MGTDEAQRYLHYVEKDWDVLFPPDPDNPDIDAIWTAEQQLVKSLSADKGRDLLKQVRTHLVETARPVMEALIQDVTGAKVLSLHHDISTITGEEVILFTLAESAHYRETKKK